MHLKTFSHEFADIGLNEHHDAFCALPSIFLSTASCLKVLYTNECAIYCTTHDRIVMYWDSGFLHCTVALEQDPPHVMLWAGIEQLV